MILKAVSSQNGCSEFCIVSVNRYNELHNILFLIFYTLYYLKSPPPPLHTHTHTHFFFFAVKMAIQFYIHLIFFSLIKCLRSEFDPIFFYCFTAKKLTSFLFLFFLFIKGFYRPATHPNLIGIS